ncbi:FRG1-like family-domain-containing protein [Mycena belliarum]|uniref:FRG1-like family-domain-containing protein n=1 Tax=Mycena belliarum TaxID=1033014 RepID=A0AAD6UBS8_9AGAR|nr:FRG1-like family-domain-containing protein [Mycena belliae]
MSDKVKSSRLTFKGDSKKKKRKREDGDGGRPSKRKDDDKDPETWVLPEASNEIRGPTFIVHPSDPSPICVTYNSTSNRVILSVLDKARADDAAEDPEPPTLLERTPTDVSQVWVITRVAGSPTVNLRTGTGEGKFLSCDAHGLVAADRDARGPQEEWTPVVLPDGMVAFMNVYEKYLSVDEVAGGALTLRGDSEEVGFRERFWIKVQYKYKKEANEEEKQKKDGLSDPLQIDETGTNKIYQTWGMGRSVTSEADNQELKRARKEGRLAEALLDRRSKLKSDRFC